MSTPRQQQSSKLQALNYSNIAAYILNAAVTYGVGLSGFFPTNEELSAKYQTIVTPAGYAFSIWGIVFLAEAIFTVAQALPAYRSSDVVVKGVGYYYVMACIAQVCHFSFTVSATIGVESSRSPRKQISL